MECCLLLGMSFSDFSCTICYSKIIIYFNEKYAGNRGKCPKCETDFPLD